MHCSPPRAGGLGGVIQTTTVVIAGHQRLSATGWYVRPAHGCLYRRHHGGPEQLPRPAVFVHRIGAHPHVPCKRYRSGWMREATLRVSRVSRFSFRQLLSPWIVYITVGGASSVKVSRAELCGACVAELFCASSQRFDAGCTRRPHRFTPQNISSVK